MKAIDNKELNIIFRRTRKRKGNKKRLLIRSNRNSIGYCI